MFFRSAKFLILVILSLFAAHFLWTSSRAGGLLSSSSSEAQLEVVPGGNEPPPEFRTRARPCQEQSEETSLLQYVRSQGKDDRQYARSQGKEDQQLFKYFNGLCGGTYIEMGAMEGITFSNSFAFNQLFGWQGVLIEGMPKMAAELPKNRPNELATIHACVCEKPRTLHYIDTDGSTSGFWELASPNFRNGFWHDKDPERDGTKVKCERMQTLLDQHAPGVHFYDFFSLDVEGAEYEVIQSIDFDKIGFGVIVIEADGRGPEKDAAVRKHLQDRGYVLQVPSRRDVYQAFENNDWFVNKHFRKIYESSSIPPPSG